MKPRPLTPDMCKCREKSLAQQINDWKQRAMPRILKAVQAGQSIDMKRLQHEAQLAASISRKGPMAFAEQNREFGHFCDDCPYRKQTPGRKADLGLGAAKSRPTKPAPPE